MELAISAAIVGAAIAIGVGVKYFSPQIKDDNPVEEVCEEVIEKETGIDVDLTPKSPEGSEKKD